MPSARLLGYLQSLWLSGWDLAVIKNEADQIIIVLTRDGESFTISQLHPDLNLRDWLANEVDKPASGLGALFG